jgi:hypothetical protein
MNTSFQETGCFDFRGSEKRLLNPLVNPNQKNIVSLS